MREGGSFNAKKKFFEKEIQEQEQQTSSQGKAGLSHCVSGVGGLIILAHGV